MAEQRRSRFRSFLLGGLLGSAAGLAAAGKVRVKSRSPRRLLADGLSAFEGAPCYRELMERERSER